MRISTKGRYALAAMIHLAAHYDTDETLSVVSIAESLGTSKIYLEQIFSLLKKSGIITSVKGAQGGYRPARLPRHITAADILSAVEFPLFEETKETVSAKAPEIDTAMRLTVFDALDKNIKNTLESVSLTDMVEAAEKNKTGGGMMFFI